MKKKALFKRTAIAITAVLLSLLTVCALIPSVLAADENTQENVVLDTYGGSIDAAVDEAIKQGKTLKLTADASFIIEPYEKLIIDKGAFALSVSTSRTNDKFKVTVYDNGDGTVTAYAYKDMGDKLTAMNISASGRISLMFYFTGLEELDDVRSYIEVRVPRKNGYSTMKITKDDLTVDDKGRYLLTVALPAALQAGKVSFQIVNAEGERGRLREYSVRDYALKALDLAENGTAADKERFAPMQDALKQMLNYGAMAQTFFELDSDVLANDGIFAEGNPVDGMTVDHLFGAEANGSATGDAELSTKVQVEAYLEDTVSLRFYCFDGETDYLKDAVARINGSSSRYKAQIDTNGRAYIGISNISAPNFDKQYTVEITTADEKAITVNYNVLNYIRAVITDESSSAEKKDLANSMYLYYTWMKSFVTKEDATPHVPGPKTEAEKEAHNCSDRTYTEVIEATCTTAGKSTVKCSDCGSVVSETVISAGAGHVFETREGKNATCSTLGWQSYQVCTECGQIADLEGNEIASPVEVPRNDVHGTSNKWVDATDSNGNEVSARLCPDCGTILESKLKTVIALSANSSVYAGYDLKIDVNVSGNTGFTSIKLPLVTDSDLSLKYKSVECADGFSCSVGGNIITITYGNGVYEGNGTVATLTYTVTSTIGGTYGIRANATVMNGDQPLELTASKSTATVVKVPFMFAVDYIGSTLASGTTNKLHTTYNDAATADASGNIKITLWFATPGGAQEYHYSLDGGNTWIKLDESYYKSVRNDIVAPIESWIPEWKGVKFNQHSDVKLQIDLSDYHMDDAPDIMLRATTAGGDEFVFATFTGISAGHRWNEGQITKAPTCISTGTKTVTCTVDGCNATETLEIAKDPNNHTGATITNKQGRDICTSCKKTLDLSSSIFGANGFDAYFSPQHFNSTNPGSGTLSEDGTYIRYEGTGTLWEIYPVVFHNTQSTSAMGRYAVVKYKTNITSTNYTAFQFYASTVTDDATKVPTSSMTYIKDEEWHIGFIDLANAGYTADGSGNYVPKLIRIDIVNPVNAGESDEKLPKGQWVDIGFLAICDDLKDVGAYMAANGNTELCSHNVTGKDAKCNRACLACGEILEKDLHTVKETYLDADGMRTYTIGCVDCDYATSYRVPKTMVDNGLFFTGTDIYNMTKSDFTASYTINGTAVLKAHAKAETFGNIFSGNTTGEGRYVVIKYRSTSSSSCDIFTSTANAGAVSGDGKQLELTKNDGQWHIMVYDLVTRSTTFKPNADGKYIPKYLRFDFFNNSGASGELEFAYIGVTSDPTDIKTLIGETGGKEICSHVYHTLGVSNGDGTHTYSLSCFCGTEKYTNNGTLFNSDSLPNYVVDATRIYDKFSVSSSHTGVELLKEGNTPFVRIHGNDNGVEPYVHNVFTSGVENAGRYLIYKYRQPVSNTKISAPIQVFAGTYHAGMHGDDNHQYNTVNDGQWHVEIVDLHKDTYYAPDANGNYLMKYMRLDFLANNATSADYIDVAYVATADDVETLIGSIHSKTDHINYPAAFNGKPYTYIINSFNGKFSLPAHRLYALPNFAGTKTIESDPNGLGYMRVTATKTTEHYYGVFEQTDPCMDVGNYIVILYRAPKTVMIDGVETPNKVGNAEVYISSAQTGTDAACHAQSANYVIDGEWHFAIINLTGLKTMGNGYDPSLGLKFLRLDYLNGTSIVGGQLDIAGLTFVNSYAEAAEYYGCFVKEYGLKCDHAVQLDALKYYDDADASSDLAHQGRACLSCGKQNVETREARYKINYDNVTGSQVYTGIGSGHTNQLITDKNGILVSDGWYGLDGTSNQLVYRVTYTNENGETVTTDWIDSKADIVIAGNDVQNAVQGGGFDPQSARRFYDATLDLSEYDGQTVKIELALVSDDAVEMGLTDKYIKITTWTNVLVNVE